jgi:hypothetical protein
VKNEKLEVVYLQSRLTFRVWAWSTLVASPVAASKIRGY